MVLTLLALVGTQALPLLKAVDAADKAHHESGGGRPGLVGVASSCSSCSPPSSPSSSHILPRPPFLLFLVVLTFSFRAKNCALQLVERA